jgi:hypothetical protein
MTYGEIIPKEILELHKLQAEKMASELKKLECSWLNRYAFTRELVMLYYERKFLKSIKRVTHAIKHS